MFSTINRNDAVAAFRAWFEAVGKERGFMLDIRVSILDSVAEIRQQLESRSVDLLILDFVDYLHLDRSGLVIPELAGTRSDTGGSRYSYVLVVNPSSSAGMIAELQGKKVYYFSRIGVNSGLAWLDVLLAKQKLGRTSSFFSGLTEAAKPQGCVLPVFFRTADACVVDEINLAVQTELNPQLGELRVLARSTPLIETVIATPAQPGEYQQELLDTILTLHQSPRGRQILTVFKTGRVIRIAHDDIEATRAFWAEFSRLTGSLDAPASKAAAYSLPETRAEASYTTNTPAER